MQSCNYVPGVSGWKMHRDGQIELAGTVRVITNQPAAESPAPFIVVDGVTYLSEAEVERATVTNAKIEPQWSIKLEVRDGQYIAGGIGLESQFMVSADKFAIKDEQPKSEIEQAISEGNAQKILDLIAGSISESDLGENLNTFNDYVRRVLRDELRPGGMLYRFNR